MSGIKARAENLNHPDEPCVAPDATDRGETESVGIHVSCATPSLEFLSYRPQPESADPVTILLAISVAKFS